MKTVRRLYFYAVAFISIEVVLWGLINLLRSIVDETVGGQTLALAQALALILVGMPIFLFHWLWAQRLAARDPEEQAAGVRAVFFYGILLATLIPLVQNILALIDRLFLDATRLDVGRAIFGHAQSWQDSVIAILMNALVAAYFWNVLRHEWPRLPDTKSFADVRRLYRYIWLLYSLLMTIFGAQQVLHFLFYVPSDVLGDIGREALINGLALLLVGTPIWVYTWSVIQKSQSDPREHDSNLRLGVLYLLALSGVITVLSTTTLVVQIVLSQILGADRSTTDFIHAIGNPVSVGVPLALVWAYYGYWLDRHIESIGGEVRQAGMKRVYRYILSAIGLGGAFVGVAMLVKFLIDYLTGGFLVLTDSLRSNLSTAIALIIVWVPLWLATWRPIQAEALSPDDRGDHARRSIVRRAYLYLALFAGVVGGMISAVALLFQLLKVLLGTAPESSFAASVLNDLQLLVLFSILLVYHLGILRRDGSASASALAKKRSQFNVVALDAPSGFGDAFKLALSKAAPDIPLTIASAQPEGRFDALVVPGSRLIDAPNWVRSFTANRIIVPDETPGWLWAGGLRDDTVQQAASAVRQLSESEPVPQRTGGSGWRIVIYIAAALFAAEIIMLLFGLVVSTLFR